jgi:hypothetical protein
MLFPLELRVPLFHESAAALVIYLLRSTQSLRQMRRQWMIGGLIEEGSFLGGRYHGQNVTRQNNR